MRENKGKTPGLKKEKDINAFNYCVKAANSFQYLFSHVDRSSQDCNKSYTCRDNADNPYGTRVFLPFFNKFIQLFIVPVFRRITKFFPQVVSAAQKESLD